MDTPELARKHHLFALELVRQGAVDPGCVPGDLIARASRSLRLTDAHWRDFDDAAIRRSACAYACGVRFRERHA